MIRQILTRQILTGVACGAVLSLAGLSLAGPAGAAGSVIQMGPPFVADYWVSVTRRPEGSLVFDGYAPDGATRAGFAALAGADIDGLRLGSGAPPAYREAMDFGLSILDLLAEGRFYVRDGTIWLSGVASDLPAYRMVRRLLAEAPPAGLVLATTQIAAPRLAEYDFAATRAKNGEIVLSGYVPSPELEKKLLRAGDVTSKLSYASGQPLDFAGAARRALDLLSHFAQGEARFDGARWLVSGVPASSADAEALHLTFAAADFPTVGWRLSLSEPARADADDPVSDPTIPSTAAPASDPPSVAVESAVEPMRGVPACRTGLARFSAQNALLFRSGAAVLAEDAGPVLDDLASILAACPAAAVDVEGHTDGDGDAHSNLALSVARAEAVIAALIARGVGGERLYAVGYGETRPIADNDTAAGKRANRRIVVVLRP